MNMCRTEDIFDQHKYDYFTLHIDKKSPVSINHSKYKFFNNINIKSPWSHQERTIDLIKENNNVMLLSGTGSGKTEAAVGSILEKINIEKEKNCQILILYPTKALTNDQFERLKGYFSTYKVCAFDADNEKRKKEVSRSEIVITNPQMLFMHLKYDTQFILFLRNLKFVVVDEFHLYDPYQISLIYAMLKHLLSESYDDVSIIFLSATIGNHDELCNELNKLSGNWKYELGETYQEEMSVIVLQRKENEELIDIINPLIEKYLYDNEKNTTLAFVPFVSMANSLTSRFKRKFKDFSNNITCHHGKLNAEERRKIENKIKHGDIRICFTTKTLQQGIDISCLNRIIHIGLPETISEFKQRQGRVGRRKGQIAESIVIPLFPSDYEHIVNKEAFMNYLSQNPESVIYNENSFAFQLALAYFKSPTLPEKSIIKSLQQMGIAKEKIDVNNYLITGDVDKELEITDYGEEIFSILSFYGQGTLKILFFKNDKFSDDGQISFQEALKNALPGCIIFHEGVPWYVNGWSSFPQNIFKSENEIKIYCIEISESPYAKYTNGIFEGTVGTYVKLDAGGTRFISHSGIFGELYLMPSVVSLLDYSGNKISSIKTTPIDSYPRLPLLTNSISLKFDFDVSYEVVEYALHAFQRSIRTAHNLAPTLFQHIIYENDGHIEGYFYETSLGNVLPQLDVEKISQIAVNMDKNVNTLWLPRCSFNMGENIMQLNEQVNHCINIIAKQITEQITKR